MSVLALDHVNLRSRDPKRTLDFFRDVLLMKVGAPPGSTGDGPGGWVYDDGDRPILHVGSADQRYPMDEIFHFEPAHGSGAVHHVALACSDFEGIRTQLQSLALDFTENDVQQMSLRQLFVTDPNGILFELNFRNGQA